jgi:hypothetical protein
MSGSKNIFIKINNTKKIKMDYKFIVSWIFITISLNTYSQNELQFKIQYFPETVYNQTVTQTSENIITYSGSKEFLQKIKDKNIQNPTVTNSSTIIKTEFKTGKLNIKNNFPITMKFLNLTNSEGKKIIPDGTIIYGQGTIDDMPKLDSIVSEGMNNEFKKGLLETMQSTFSQITFPNRKLKIGESFSQETPLSLPVLNNTIEMTMLTNYKLISIENNLGNFEVSQIYTMKSNISNNEIVATGSGKGKIVYDIKNNFFLKYLTDGEIEMDVKMKDISIKMKSKNTYIQDVIISKK